MDARFVISLTRGEANAIHDCILFFSHEAPRLDRMLLEMYRPQFATYATRGTPEGNILKMDADLAMAVRRCISRNRSKLNREQQRLLGIVYEHLCFMMDDAAPLPNAWTCHCGNRNGPGMIRCGSCEGHFADSKEKQGELF